MDAEAAALENELSALASSATANMQKAQARQQADYDKRRPMDALPDSGSYVLVRRMRGDKFTKRSDGPFLCIGYNKGCTIALLESADGKRWTENVERIAPFQVPDSAPRADPVSAAVLPAAATSTGTGSGTSIQDHPSKKPRLD